MIWIAQQNNLAQTIVSTNDTQKQITILKDVEDKGDSTQIQKDSYAPSNPFPSQVPSQIVGRRFLVQEIPWQVGAGLSADLDFPGLLLAVPTIAEYLQAFAWMRANVELEVRMNATPYHYGAFLVSYIPNHEPTTHCADYLQCSGNNPVVCSASIAQGCHVHLPWINPLLFYPISTGTSEIALVSLREIAPLSTISNTVSDTVSIQIYAAFSNVDVAGYLPIAAPSPIAQSGKGKFVNSSGELVEADGKAADNSTATAAETAEKVGSYFGPIGDIVKGVLSIGKGIAKLFTLDKPTSVSHPMIAGLNPVWGVARGQGIDMSDRLSLYTDATTHNCSVEMGNKTPSLSLWDVACTPMIHAVQTFTDVDESYAMPVTPLTLANNGAAQMDYLAAVTNIFEYWRGPIKYMFQFFTSPFITGRFKIELLYSTTIPDPENTGDAVTQIVDVKGDTTVSLEVPFLWYTMWRSIRDNIELPILRISPLIKPIGPSMAVDSPIHVVIWRAAGESFQWMKLRAPYLTSQAGVTKAQSNVGQLFKGNFQPIIKGCHNNVETKMCSPEQVTHFQDIWKRPETSDTLRTYAPNANRRWLGHISYCSNFFKYWHGSRRVKNSYSAGIPIAVYANDAGTFTANPSIGESYPVTNSVRSWLQFEIPYYNLQPYLPVYPASTPTLQSELPPYVDSVAGTLETTMWCGGEDFTYGYLVAPIILPAPVQTVPPTALVANTASSDVGTEKEDVLTRKVRTARSTFPNREKYALLRGIPRMQREPPRAPPSPSKGDE
jgi:hypothetical protein